MAFPFLFLVLALIILSHSRLSSSSSPPHGLTKGSSLSVEKREDILVSPNGLFTAGFFQVGTNAYCFAIWFSELIYINESRPATATVFWMANRDVPVNGKRSKLSLLKTGNLVLTDAGQSPVWSTNTKSNSTSLQLQLINTGNLVLYDNRQHLWQSFNFPTDTLLPNQPLSKHNALVSSRSSTNFSSGFYKLSFDNDNVLRLLYNDPEITSVYWPDPWLNSWEGGRSTYDNSRIAVLNSSGHFNSSDDFKFSAADVGLGPQRRLTLDSDGNIRVYSLVEQQRTRKWQVSWQAIPQPCKIHGICGQNSLCTYDHKSGRKCTCLHGYKMKNYTDWSYGCEPEFKPCKHGEDDDFIKLPHAEFYGYDSYYLRNSTLKACTEECLKVCTCKGFQFKQIDEGVFSCFIKSLLFNGYQLGFQDSVYIKLPKSWVSSYHQKFQESSINCRGNVTTELKRSYEKKHENGLIKFMLWFSSVFGGIEMICIAFFLYKTRKPSSPAGQNYLPVVTGFKRFTYAKLKNASRNFREEIGRGGGGVVYKGVLSDNRVAAIKHLKEASKEQGEAEFLAEISIIGRLNHMNLIETWGYCAEGKHRLLVYEYMENGSLAENLHSNKLDWEKRFEIAVGTAKGLAYLHEECLEWVLHCDVKPHNILLGTNYEPKVADFGLSKLFSRGGIGNSSFSRIRGTRGYMAPEWVFNLPITSKVDVYSYGVVMLEMITGRSPAGTHATDDNGGTEQMLLVSWVREKIHGPNGSGRGAWIDEIADPTMSGEYDRGSMKNLIKVALQCAEEDKDARPTMSQVVDMLLHPEN